MGKTLIDAKREAVLELLEDNTYRRFDWSDGCGFMVNGPGLISTLIDMTEGGEVQIQVDLNIEEDEFGDDSYGVTAHLNSTMQSKAELVLNLVLGRFIEYRYYSAAGPAVTAFTKTVNALHSISSASAA
tara:strand:- start:98 stop:484 length:387 start_codon:yes stop_codon:yes gene_type:complete